MDFQETSARFVPEFHQQVDNTLSRRYEGTVLRASLTWRLVELLGGLVWVERGGEGLESTFGLLTPIGNRGSGMKPSEEPRVHRSCLKRSTQDTQSWQQKVPD